MQRLRFSIHVAALKHVRPTQRYRKQYRKNSLNSYIKSQLIQHALLKQRIYNSTIGLYGETDHT